MVSVHRLLLYSLYLSVWPWRLFCKCDVMSDMTYKTAFTIINTCIFHHTRVLNPIPTPMMKKVHSEKYPDFTCTCELTLLLVLYEITWGIPGWNRFYPITKWGLEQDSTFMKILVRTDSRMQTACILFPIFWLIRPWSHLYVVFQKHATLWLAMPNVAL